MSIRTLISVASVGIFLFSAPLLASAAVSFQGGWESGSLTGNGNWGYTQIVPGGYAYQIVSDVVRTGSKAARIEVRPGDNPLACCAGSSRSEVLILTDQNGNDINETVNSGTKYFGFSVRLAPDWQSPEWSVIYQLHGPDSLGASPSVAIEVAGDTFQYGAYSGDLRTINERPLKFPLGPNNKGQWVDFILKLTFAGDTTGAVTVWRRNEGETNFTQVLDLPNWATLQHNGGAIGDHYWKFGFYRKDANYTNVLWNDGFVRADTFDEVLASFGNTTPPPPQDTTVPSTPAALSVTAVSQSSINLAWSASSDNIGVTGYNVFRNGVQIGTTQATSYSDTGLAPSTLYSYRVSAFDAAGNVSAQSSQASATTQAAPFSLTLEAENMQTKSAGYLLPDGFWNLNSAGHLSHAVSFPSSGTYTFDITARGTKADRKWPNMRVSIDGNVKSNVTVNSSTAKTFRVSVTGITAGQHTLKLEFTNDYYNASKNEDRNLYIDKTIIKSASTSALGELFLALTDSMSVAGIRMTAIVTAAVGILESLFTDEGAPYVTQSV